LVLFAGFVFVLLAALHKFAHTKRATNQKKKKKKMSEKEGRGKNDEKN